MKTKFEAFANNKTINIFGKEYRFHSFEDNVACVDTNKKQLITTMTCSSFVGEPHAEGWVVANIKGKVITKFVFNNEEVHKWF